MSPGIFTKVEGFHPKPMKQTLKNILDNSRHSQIFKYNLKLPRRGLRIYKKTLQLKKDNMEKYSQTQHNRKSLMFTHINDKNIGELQVKRTQASGY